jgi:rubrerythrin
MQEFKSVDDILDFAIAREQEAVDFYTGLAGKMETPGIKTVFEGFAKEEQGHKEKLLRVKDGKILLKSEAKVLDLKIGDYLVDVEATPDMDYQQALIVAMKKEKAAFKLYMDLSAKTDDADIAALFVSLASEEAKHKLRFEIIYDEQILTEN